MSQSSPELPTTSPRTRTAADLPLTAANIAALVEENKHLRLQRDQLQGRMSAMVEGSRRRRVAAFMEMAGQAMPPRPTVPEDAIVRMRLRLIAEEFFELLYSALDEFGLEEAEALVMTMIERRGVKVDLPEFVDALIDLDYVNEGAKLAFGTYGEPVEAAVHAANMEKGKGPLRADGKKEKPPGWKPPDVAGLLKAQGWQP